MSTVVIQEEVITIVTIGTQGPPASGGAGSITSVGMTGDDVLYNTAVTNSPITESGNLIPVLKTQLANLAFLSPDGTSGVPTWRSLVNNDLPIVGMTKGGSGANLSAASAGSIFYKNGSGVLQALAPAANQTIRFNSAANAIESYVPNTGTVTSVGFTGDNVVFDSAVSGAPVTNSGTFAPSLKSQAANRFLASPDGSSGVWTSRAIALGDLPLITMAKGGSGADLSGAAQGSVFFKNGSGILQALAPVASKPIRFNSAANAVETYTPNDGTVTDFSAGDLAPIFTTSEANTTTTPALSFTLSNISQYQFLGRSASGSGAPSYQQIAFSYLSGTATAGQLPANVAYTDAANSWSAAQAPNAAGTIDIGTTLLPFRNLYVGGAATNNNKIASATTTAARTFTLPDADSNSVIPDAGASNNFLTGITSNGVVTKAQPAFNNLSGNATIAQGGTNNPSLGVSALGIYIGDGSKIVQLAATAGQSWRVNAGGTAIEAYTSGSGGSSFTREVKTANFSAIAGDIVYLCSNAIDADLPSLSGLGDSRLTFVNEDTDTVMVNADGSDLIMGESSIPVGPGESITLVNGSTQWRMI